MRKKKFLMFPWQSYLPYANIWKNQSIVLLFQAANTMTVPLIYGENDEHLAYIYLWVNYFLISCE
jgi:hypothetical protein